MGPDSFRRFLSKTSFGVLKNVELGINIEEHLPKISDYGNIQTDSIANGQKTMNEAQLQELYDKLQKKFRLCLERNNMSFVIGGSKDMFPSLQKAYGEICKEKVDV